MTSQTPAGLHFPAFRRWHTNILRAVLSTRADRVIQSGHALDTIFAPVQIATLSIAASFDEDFAVFADIVGGEKAVGYFVRALQYVARGHALTGNIPVSRARFGPAVLTCNYKVVNGVTGAKVFDALLASSIAIPLDEAEPFVPAVVQLIPLRHREAVAQRVAQQSEAWLYNLSRNALSNGKKPPLDNALEDTRARACADRAVPCRTVPPHPTPEGNDPGGSSASPPDGERHDPDDWTADAGQGAGDTAPTPAPAPAPPRPPGGGLSPDDLGVFEALWRQREKMLAPDRAMAERLADGLRAKTPDVEAILAFVDRMTPSFLDEVTKVRRAFRMSANARVEARRWKSA